MERTAPFVRPITFPGVWDIILRDSLKVQLEGAGLLGIAFRPVIKAHIVFSDWEHWDQSARQPKEYPKEGEPEEYILDKPHSSKLAEEMGSMWELGIETVANPDSTEVDFWQIPDKGYNFVSQRAKHWLEQNLEGWVEFAECRPGNG
jgi:hypothetical protein